MYKRERGRARTCRQTQAHAHTRTRAHTHAPTDSGILCSNARTGECARAHRSALTGQERFAWRSPPIFQRLRDAVVRRRWSERAEQPDRAERCGPLEQLEELAVYRSRCTASGRTV